MPTAEELQDFLSTASQLAIDASELLKKMQGTQITVVQKDQVDMSTTADIAAERLIMTGIQSKFPSHGIYSEEAGEINEVSEYMWIIDPLDGTKEYARGSDDFNVLIALEYQKELIVGAYSRNINGSLYTSSLKQGGFVNGRKLFVSSNSELSTSSIGFRLPRKSNGENVVSQRLSILQDLINTLYRVRCPSDDAHALAMVASGHLDAHILHDGVCGWYDVAPAVLLVKEAGGLVTDFYGNPIKSGDFSRGFIASNSHIHTQLLELIAPHI